MNSIGLCKSKRLSVLRDVRVRRHRSFVTVTTAMTTITVITTAVTIIIIIAIGYYDNSLHYDCNY